MLADEQKKLYPDCWKRKVKPSQAATSNSSQASPTFSGAIFARFNKKIKKTRDPHHPKAFSNECTERGSKLKARKVAPGFIFRLSGAGQSPGLSPHPVFHPPSSPGSNFYHNEFPNTKKIQAQMQMQKLSNTNTKTFKHKYKYKNNVRHASHPNPAGSRPPSLFPLARVPWISLPPESHSAGDKYKYR